MHCDVKKYVRYHDLLEVGVTKSIAYSVTAYFVIGWSSLNRRNRLEVVKYRKPSPGICPHCGEHKPRLFNTSGKYLDDDSDYEWTCLGCHLESIKPKRTFVRLGDKLKPWSELKRRAKVSRIRKTLKKPDTCHYCDCTITELVSKSGTWLEDLTDYVWVCRRHAGMIQALRPEPAAGPCIQCQEPFESHSILNKNCAGGRFLAVDIPSFENGERS